MESVSSQENWQVSPRALEIYYSARFESYFADPPRVGHFPQMEAPDDFAREVEALLAEVTGDVGG